jgi:hypothetical protein
MHFGSDVLMQLFFGLLVQSESLFSKFPAIPSLKDETESLAQSICSRPIIHRLAQGRVIDNICMKFEEAKEIERWRQRWPSTNRDGSASTSPFPMGRVSTLSKTRSVEYRSESDQGDATALAAWMVEPRFTHCENK